MKKLLSGLVFLLSFVAGPTTFAQGLTLDQLTYINSLEQMSQNAYLTDRGWKFEHVTNQGDSITYLYWRYYDSHNTPVGEVAVLQKEGERDALIYRTSPSAPFEAIRNKVMDYHMELLGTNNSDGAMRTYYRGNRYEVMLSLTKDESESIYTVRVQPHGLVKAYSFGEDGKQTEQWVRLPPATAAQQARWKIFADSIARINLQRAKQKTPVKQGRK